MTDVMQCKFNLVELIKQELIKEYVERGYDIDMIKVKNIDVDKKDINKSTIDIDISFR